MIIIIIRINNYNINILMSNNTTISNYQNKYNMNNNKIMNYKGK